MAACSESLKVVRSESVLNAIAGIVVRPTSSFHAVLLTFSPKNLRIPFIYALATLAVASHAALPPAIGETPMPTLAPMIKRVSPAVVNIATRGTIRERSPRNPLLEDP